LLEIAKLLVSVSVPIIVLFLGLWIRRFTEHIERRTRYSQIEVDWRLSVFKELAPKLNALYCAFNYVGGWREMMPRDIVAAKRECDRVVNTNRFLWSEDFLNAYAGLVAAGFMENRGPGLEFLIRANRDRYRGNELWRDDWHSHFVEPQERVHRKDFNKAYDAAINFAVRDLEIFSKP
jgi:hypothetical protein